MTYDFDNRLCEAVWAGDLDEVKSLLTLGADVDCYEYSGNTPLHLAVEQGEYEIAKVLLEAGAAVDRRDRGGSWTPLVHAAQAESLAGVEMHQTPNNLVIRLLLDYGADVHQRSYNGHSSLYFARTYDNAEAVEILRAAGARE